MIQTEQELVSGMSDDLKSLLPMPLKFLGFDLEQWAVNGLVGSHFFPSISFQFE
jgi:hypothetical protein